MKKDTQENVLLHSICLNQREKAWRRTLGVLNRSRHTMQGAWGILLALPLLIHGQDKFPFRMPTIAPKAENYVCTSIDVTKETSIVGFAPLNENRNAHHILLFGCDQPGSDEEVWDCGEMEKGEGEERAPPCLSTPTILYAWAKDAPPLHLPEDVGFRVGPAVGRGSIVMQVHYMHDGEKDTTGVELETTDRDDLHQASTMLMVTGGFLPAGARESFESACLITAETVIHPFAFRTHTHRHGTDVAAWRVRERDGDDQWTLIGRRDPQLPQMFVPVNDSSLTLTQGDVIAARCVMKNNEDHEIEMGSTAEDEMCNMYIMYWSEGEQLADNTCYSPGAPFYHLKGLNHIPK